MADVGNISVKIEADLERLDASLMRAEQNIKRSAQKMDTQFAGAANALAKVFGAAGAIEGTFRGLILASSLFRGDTEAALEAAKRLPFGIGAAVDAAAGLVRELSGAAEQEQRILDIQREQRRESERRQAAASQRATNARNAAARGQAGLDLLDFTRDLEAQAPALERDRLIASQFREQARLAKQFDNSGADGGDAIRLQARATAALKAVQARALAEFDSRERAKTLRSIMDMEKAQKERSRRAAEQQQKAATRSADKIAQMQAQASQAATRSADKIAQMQAQASQRKQRGFGARLDANINAALGGLNDGAGVQGGGQFRSVEAGRFSFANTATFRKAIEVRIVRDQIDKLVAQGIPGFGVFGGL